LKENDLSLLEFAEKKKSHQGKRIAPFPLMMVIGYQ